MDYKVTLDELLVGKTNPDVPTGLVTTDQLLQWCATDTGNELVKSGTTYTGDNLILAKRFIQGLNYAKNKIARERYTPSYKETMTLDSDLCFSLTKLTKVFKNVVSITLNDSEINWIPYSSWRIRCPGNKENDTITVEYRYIPQDLSADALGAYIDFPLGIVDPRTLCFYADYEYLITEEEQAKATYWLSLWNDAFDSINPNIGETNMIKNVYGVW
jgi:hypothetical protein